MITQMRIQVQPIISMFIALLLLTLAACGGGADSTANSTPVSGGTAPVTAPVAPQAAASLTLSLIDPTSGGAKNSISSSSPGSAKATVKNADGSPASGVVVIFTTDATLATLTPASGTALTDASGVASVTIAAASVTAAGAATVDAKAQLGANQVTGSAAFAIGATSVTLSTPLTLGTSPLSAFGTTSASVTVLSNGQPFTSPLLVNFTSGCATNGKADLTPSVTTVNGVATASYRDKGCSGSDTITATLSGISATSSATLTVTAPSTGSIQFVSANPTQITLKGTGGAGLKETSEVRFKVVDQAGNPVGGKTVTFALSTTVGGIALTSASAVSDPTTGEAITGVQSGSISTPVRVLATTTSAGVSLATQSDQLTITTGVPTQSSFSLSVTTHNIEGWRIDGANTTINARLADHFGNPPPAGSVVNFISEGGKVAGSCTTQAGGSTTESGVCSALFTSQALRPDNGRITVLAYAVGEESFVDLNGDGFVDSRSELVDANGNATVGGGEAFVDFDESSADTLQGTRDSNEPFLDFNNNGNYDGPTAAASALYKGILCKESSGLCNPTKTLHIRQSQVILLSGSDPYVSTDKTALNVVGGPQTINLMISDLHGNALPAGTTIGFAATNGTIDFSGGSFPVPDTTACMSNTDSLANGPALPAGLCPALARNAGALRYSVTVKSDGTSSGPSGRLSVTVTTPGGGGIAGKATTIALATVTD